MVELSTGRVKSISCDMKPVNRDLSTTGNPSCR